MSIPDSDYKFLKAIILDMNNTNKDFTKHYSFVSDINCHLRFCFKRLTLIRFHSSSRPLYLCDLDTDYLHN